MDPPVVIEYFYFSNRNNVDFDKAVKHQLTSSAIKEYFLEQDAINSITYTDIINLLQRDGANFRANSIRYSIGGLNTFFRMGQDFVFKLAGFLPGERRRLLLLLEPENRKLKHQLKKLSNRVQRLERQFKFTKKLLRSHFIQTVSPPLHDITFNQLEEEGSKETIASLQTTSQIATPKNSRNSQSELLFKLRNSRRDSDATWRALSLGNSDSAFLPFLNSNRKLDIAIMIAEPLVEIVGSKAVFSLPDAVDYEDECREIYSTLRDKEGKIFMTYEIATRTNLVNVLSKNPSILHIMCHGEYDSENNKFYLCFENSNSEIDRLYADDLRDILQKFETSVQLVFVNACHSEPVAQVFADAGVPCVIAVQSQLQIADTFAKKFASLFYHFIFDGKSVKEAFNLARTASADPLSHSCCCAHAHKPKCKWAALARKEGYYKAHIYHEPLCTACKQKRENIHNFTCPWAEEFRTSFSIEDYQNFEGSEITVSTCCCSPELAHNELLKFILLSKSKESEMLVLFDQLEPGKVQNIKFYSVIDQRFPEKRILGRNRQIYEISKVLRSSCKILKLEGPNGVGKTATARYAANYLYSRNAFRYKISMLDLHSTSSISKFLVKMFNEIELANDMESFLDAVRTQEVLFILDNVDAFIETDRIGFSDCLQKITFNTKCVKFLIIIEKPIDLGLEEVSIKLGNLFPIDAARLLLLNTPLDRIQPMRYRNIEELKNTELFSNYFDKISTKTLWWIQRKLLQGQKFDKIEKELLTQFQSASSQNDSVELVASTLSQIQKEDSIGYKLILKICSFPSGLSFLDLETLSKIEDFQFDWKNSLVKLLTAKEEKEVAQLTSELETTSSAELRRSRSRRKRSPHRSYVFTPEFKAGSYFWLHIVSPKEGELIFKPAESVSSIVYDKPDLNALEAELEKMEYLSFVSLWLLEMLITTHSYSEKLLENSAICKHGLWEVAGNNALYSKYLTVRPELMITNEEPIKSSTLQDIFRRNEYNFRSCSKLAMLQKIAAEETLKSRLMDVAEVLFFAIPTIFNIFTKGQEVAVYMATKYISILDKLQFDDPRVNLLKVKLHLFLLGYTVTYGEEERTYKTDFEAIGVIKAEMKDETIKEWINFEVAFVRAVCAKTKREQTYDNEKLATQHKEYKYKIILDTLEYECNPLLNKLTQNHEFASAKVMLYTCEIKIKNKTISETDKNVLLDSIKVFEKYGATQLEVRTHICLTRLYFTQFLEKTKSGSFGRMLLEESANLDQIRKNHLKRRALRQAQLINNPKLVSKSTQLINLINLVVRRGFFNLLIFLHAKPMRFSISEIEKEMSKNSHITIPNFFKSELIDVLNHRNRVLNVKFEVLTKESLEASISMGCRILYISSEMISEEGLIVEDSEFRPHLLKFKELKQLFEKRKLKRDSNSGSEDSPTTSHKYKLETVIIGSRNDVKLAEFFVTEIQVPHVVCFEFNEIEDEQFRSQLYQTEYINKFVQFFLNDLVADKAIQESFENAKKDTIDCLSYSFFNQASESEVSSLLGKGALLLPPTNTLDAPHDHALFGWGQYILQKGKVEDISLQRFSGTISKSILPFFGRSSEISQIFDYVMTNPDQLDGFLQIVGEEGVGKTRLALEVAWYLYQRNAFPDGIFYLPLKKLNKMNILTMIEIASEKLGVPLDKNHANYFRKKKILLIFDDFDVFYSGDVELPTLLLSIVKKAKIPVIVLCKKYYLREATDETSQRILKQFKETQNKVRASFVSREFSLERLSKAEIANMLLSLSSPGYEDAVTFKEMLENPAIKKINGLPSRVVEGLLTNKFFYRLSPLKMLQVYIPFQALDKRCWRYFKNGGDAESRVRANPLLVSRHSIAFNSEVGDEIKTIDMSDEENKGDSAEEKEKKQPKYQNMEKIMLFNRTSTMFYGDDEDDEQPLPKMTINESHESTTTKREIPVMIEVEQNSDIEENVDCNKSFSFLSPEK